MNFGVIAVTLSLELSIALACNASDTTASERQRVYAAGSGKPRRGRRNHQ